MKIHTITLSKQPYGNTQATLQVYVQDHVSLEEDHRPMALICPGGGYEYCSDREGEPVALAFLQKGYHAAVLQYSVLDEKEEKELLPYPQYDVANAIASLRDNSTTWGIDTTNIILIGFSAGGHLVSTYSNLCKEESFVKACNVTQNIQIKAAILGYPVIDLHAGWPNDINYMERITKDERLQQAQCLVSERSVPTFVWHTVSDQSVPVENSLRYVQALQQHHINHEYHTFHKGKHGLSLANKQSAKQYDDAYILPHVASWFTLAIEWLDDILSEE